MHSTPYIFVTLLHPPTCRNLPTICPHFPPQLLRILPHPYYRILPPSPALSQTTPPVCPTLFWQLDLAGCLVWQLPVTILCHLCVTIMLVKLSPLLDFPTSQARLTPSPTLPSCWNPHCTSLLFTISVSRLPCIHSPFLASLSKHGSSLYLFLAFSSNIWCNNHKTTRNLI